MQAVSLVSTPTAKHVPVKKEVFMFKTKDSYTLLLSRMCPEKEVGAHSHPVMLIHGLASNRFTFDLNPSKSISSHLASKGWDTWILELRGSGKCKGLNSGHAKEISWNFEDHIEDVSAALEFVHKLTNRAVHLIGHSMGAMLVQCLAAGRNKHMVRSGVSIAGSFLMETSRWLDFMWLLPFVKGFHLETIHVEFIQKTLGPMSHSLNTPWDHLFFQHENTESDAAFELFQKNWEPLSVCLVSQISSVFEVQGLLSHPGNKPYNSILKEIEIPMCCIAGSMDSQCPPDDMKKASSLMQNSTFKCFGKKSGQECEYGHFDLIIGRNAKKEVWQEILHFLVEND
jgi:pimeloyl-ACP methyl ester carboxylesterase